MTPKPWYQSKTIWIALIQGVIGVLAALSANPDIHFVGYIAIAKSGLDIILRALTSESVQ